jgi:hypothetical protein
LPGSGLDRVADTAMCLATPPVRHPFVRDVTMQAMTELKQTVVRHHEHLEIAPPLGRSHRVVAESGRQDLGVDDCAQNRRLTE